MAYELVPLHKNKHHFDDCIHILNSEWPRSKAAREHSLNKSCDDLPCCLVYREMNSQEVVGYSRIVDVQGKDKACLFESVIIHHDLRGKGLGRKLMEATEKFAKQMNFKTVYLNTLDKEGFYFHLGYTRCGPVVSLGANAGRVSEEFLQKLTGPGISPSSTLSSSVDETKKTTVNSCTAPSLAPSISSSSDPVLPPVPPPPPTSSIPPPPLLPPSISSPPPSEFLAQSKATPNRHVMRMDPNAVIWMHKAL